jgi:hypothetical protein
MDQLPDWIENYDDNPNALSAKARALEILAKRCAPKVYGDRQEIGLSGADGGPIHIVTAIPEPDPAWGETGDGQES